MQSGSAQAEMLQFVTFRLAGRTYAVDIRRVQEIDTLKEITKIPNAPDYVEGAINLRGKVIPVLNTRKRFGMEAKAPDELSKIVIMDVRGITMGFLVDSVSPVLRAPADAVEPPPPVSSAAKAAFIMGIAKLSDGLVVLLDMDRLLSDDERTALFGDAKMV